MNEQIISQEGYDKLRHELSTLIKVKRPEIAHRIQVAKDMGDLSENAESPPCLRAIPTRRRSWWGRKRPRSCAPPGERGLPAATHRYTNGPTPLRSVAWRIGVPEGPARNWR
ncbi:hypothetical protein HGA64_02110, partial [Candidatus Falkowbacteria bacterium]|nr:hypothetical protein [Candidatus Falkowbacteria bacterium]